MKDVIGPVVSLAIVMCLATSVRADVVPPDTAACSGKQAGDVCTVSFSDAGPSSCQNATCSKLDYAHWDRDASSGPPTASYACLKCAPDTTTNTQTVTDTRTATETPTTTQTAAGSQTATETPTATHTTSDTQTATSLPVTVTSAGTDTSTNDQPPAGDDGGCSLGQHGTARRLAPWLLAASFSLLFLFVRRRRR